jgi:hypothetical protein
MSRLRLRASGRARASRSESPELRAPSGGPDLDARTGPIVDGREPKSPSGLSSASQAGDVQGYLTSAFKLERRRPHSRGAAARAPTLTFRCRTSRSAAPASEQDMREDRQQSTRGITASRLSLSPAWMRARRRSRRARPLGTRGRAVGRRGHACFRPAKRERAPASEMRSCSPAPMRRHCAPAAASMRVLLARSTSSGTTEQCKPRRVSGIDGPAGGGAPC